MNEQNTQTQNQPVNSDSPAQTATQSPAQSGQPTQPQSQPQNNPESSAVKAPAVEKVEKKEIKKEKKEKKAKKKANPNISRGDGGINLIPPLTEAQVKTEKTKFTVNLSAAYTLLFLFVLTIIVVGFNVYQRLSLNSEKAQLFELERQLNLRSDLLGYNDEIVRRIKLYENIEETAYSSKEVLDYWEGITEGIGEINSIELSSGLGFEVTGVAGSLSDVARLWYLLANDPHIESVTIDNVIRDGATARFSFEGRLNFKEFSSNQ